MKNYILFTTALLVFIYAKCEAQKIFSEGILKYDVFINNEDKPSGLYVISVKGGNIKRELAMNNGFNNITIYTVKNGKTLSLNLNDGNKYALEMSQEEVNEKNLKFSNAQFVDLNKQKKIAGYACMGNKVTYANSEKADFYYTPDLLPPTENFNAMFPNLKGVPLEYEVKSNPSMTMKFVATLVDNMVIDSKIFIIPVDYKIVTKEELNKLK